MIYLVFNPIHSSDNVNHNSKCWNQYWIIDANCAIAFSGKKLNKIECFACSQWYEHNTLSIQGESIHAATVSNEL